MQISEKRLAANRANALKSTGPKTARGKRASSRNALKHGVLSKAVIIDGESVQSFDNLVEAYCLQYQPDGPAAHGIIHKVAAAEWFMLRGWSVHSAAMNREVRRQAAAHPEYDTPTCVLHAARVLAEDSRHVELMSRYQHRYDMQHHRGIQVLERMKAAKDAKAAKAAKESSLACAKRTHQPDENKESQPLPKATEKPLETHLES